MRGFDDLNAPAFAEAAAQLRSEGHEVFNPAEVVPLGGDIRSAMAADLQWLVLFAEAIAVLPGWRESRGALAEVAAGVSIGIPVIHMFRKAEGRFTARMA